MSSATLGVLVILFLIVSALFSAAETALFAMPRARLRRLAGRESLVSEVFRQVLEAPQRILVAILLGNTLASVAATAVGVIVLERLLGGMLSPIAILIVQLLLMSFLLLVFSELAPKTHALEHWESSTQRLAFFVRLSTVLLRPFSKVLEGLAHLSSRLFSSGPGGGASIEDLQNLIAEGEQKGTLSREEARLFSGAFHLRQLSAADVMIHRTDLVSAPVDSPATDLIELVSVSGHSLIPVYERSVDRIVGMVDSADLLPMVLDKNNGKTAREIMKLPILVPPSRSLEELLLSMQRERLQVVVVAKTSGETLGIVTLEDIVEEVVGEIQSEFEEEEAAVRLLEDGSAVVQANVRIKDINRLLGTHLASDEDGTVGALVHRLWPEPPAEGDEKLAESGDQLHIESMVGTRVWSVRVRRDEWGNGR